MGDFASRLATPQASGFTPGLLPGTPRSLPRPSLLGSAEGAATLAGFDFGKSDLKPKHLEALKTIAPTYQSLLASSPAGKVRAVGHTDAVGSEADNDTLGQARADAVGAELSGLGVESSAIETRSLGEAVPSVESKKAEPANRRVELYFMPGPDLSGILTEGLKPPDTLGPTPKTDIGRPTFDFCKVFPEECDPNRISPDIYKPIPPLKGGKPGKSFSEGVWEPIDDALKKGLKGLGISDTWNDRLRGWAKAGAKKGAEAGLDAILDQAGATGDTKKAAAAALKAAAQLEIPF